MIRHLITLTALTVLTSGIGVAGTAEVLSPAQIMQLKFQEICARADEDRDGYITRREFPDLQRPAPVFHMADANADGRLDQQECERVLGTADGGHRHGHRETSQSLVNPPVAAGRLAERGSAIAASKDQAPAGAEPTFRQIDSNRDGALSLEELIEVGQDDLTFRAMDIDGDARISPQEFAQRRQLDKDEKPANASPPR